MGTAAQEFNARFERIGSAEAIAERAAERAEYERRYAAMMERKRGETAGRFGKTADGRRTFYCNAIGADLIVYQCGWSREMEEAFGTDAIISGAIDPDRYWIATQDGRSYDQRGWCECGGASSDDAGVFVERWSEAGREFHGWICRECRKLVQAG